MVYMNRIQYDIECSGQLHLSLLNCYKKQENLNNVLYSIKLNINYYHIPYCWRPITFISLIDISTVLIMRHSPFYEIYE